MVSPIYFHHTTKSIRLKNSKGVKNLIIQIFRYYNIKLIRLDYIFCSDKYLLKINEEFLGHDFYTDVITFSLSKVEEPVVGEIYISIDRVKENAEFFKVAYEYEVLRVMIHGALHLCGINDENNEDKIIMREMEDFFLKQYHKVLRESVSLRNRVT